jgi:phosphatidylinositol alpha-mannosyltransferase
MRIAMLGRALPRPDSSGGVSGQMHLLANAVARRGNHVTVFSLNPPGEPSQYEYRPIPVPRAVLDSPRAAIYLAPWWAGRIPLDEFDVIHAHGDDHFLRTRRPVVRTFYGTSRAEARYSTTLRHKLYHLSTVLFEYISERRAEVVTTISQGCLQYLTHGAIVIPCGYDPKVFFPAGEKTKYPSILFVGDLGTRKRGDLLVDLFQRVVRPTIPSAELWMVTNKTVVAPGVRWFGRVPTATLVDLYRQAWVYCMPSRYEGFGVPYLEAMACGTPVVATWNGGAQELLDGGRYGRLVEDQALGPELIALLSNAEIRNVFAAAGAVRAKEYVILRIAERYEAIYRAVAGISPAAQS